MNRSDRKNGFLSYNNLLRAAAVLFILTMISVWWVSGLFAKFIVSDNRSDAVRAAAFSEIAVKEHKVVYDNGVYSLDTSKAVSSNEYSIVVPGTKLPKDPFVTIDGNSDTSGVVYIEVNDDGLPDEITYSISSDWTLSDDIAPMHGGRIYQYKNVLPAHTETLIEHIIKDDELAVSENFRDKSNKTKNSGSFSMVFYAYLIQTD